jgi:hypothetical protein
VRTQNESESERDRTLYAHLTLYKSVHECMNECMYVCMHGITGATSSMAFFLAASTTLSDQSTPASTVMRHAPAPPCRARSLRGSALRKKCGVGQSEHEQVAEEQALGDKTLALANALLPSTAAARKTRSHRKEAMVPKSSSRFLIYYSCCEKSIFSGGVFRGRNQ